MKLFCITGTRADYGILRPLLYQLYHEPDYDLQLIVTGMHLSEEYGHSIKEIEKDPFPITATPNILVRGDSTSAMSQSVGIAILYFADLFERYSPEWILLLGDRGEMLAAAIAAHYQNIGIIHLHGGEISGSADDCVRHAISKLAHLHFVSTLRSKEHLIQLGEDHKRIVPVGSLRKADAEGIIQLDQVTEKEWLSLYPLHSERKKLLVAMHPDSKDHLSFQEQIDITLNALKGLTDAEIILLGPNSDAGGEMFRSAMLYSFTCQPHVHYYSNVPADHYLFLLSKVDVLVGNSSSGIIEAPFFRLPFVHIGNRQRGRETGGNVFFVPYDPDKIRCQINRVLQGNVQIKGVNPYDLGLKPHVEIVNAMNRMIHNKWVKQKQGITINNQRRN